MKYLEGQVRIPSGCAISAVISKDGNKMTGASIMESMKPMHERSNGLGGGFAAYGIYPDYKDCFALHLFFHDNDCRAQCERYLKERLEVVWAEEIPTRKIPEITDEPLIWRYFATAAPLPSSLAMPAGRAGIHQPACVIRINTRIDGRLRLLQRQEHGRASRRWAIPEDVGRFYRLDEYEGYSWTAHGRYPTNTPGWWGGAHPFALLDYSMVHNGEISSYDANRRFIEMYRLQLHAADRHRGHHLYRRLSPPPAGPDPGGDRLRHCRALLEHHRANEPQPEAAAAAPTCATLFPSLLVTGPFSILLGFDGRPDGAERPA